jgi:polyphosphate glucokinase
MDAKRMVDKVASVVRFEDYAGISIGYPGPVVHGRPVAEPHNLAEGWVGFHYEKAFGRPVRIVRDAAMQALGSYRGRRMLFLGLGTGLGSALIVGGTVEPMELAHLPYKKGRSYEEYVGNRGLERLGKRRWRRHVANIVAQLKTALQADYVVLGGGNARLLDELPKGAERGENSNAFRGGQRLWRDLTRTTSGGLAGRGVRTLSRGIT